MAVARCSLLALRPALSDGLPLHGVHGAAWCAQSCSGCLLSSVAACSSRALSMRRISSKALRKGCVLCPSVQVTVPCHVAFCVFRICTTKVSRFPAACFIGSHHLPSCLLRRSYGIYCASYYKVQQIHFGYILKIRRHFFFFLVGAALHRRGAGRCRRVRPGPLAEWHAPTSVKSGGPAKPGSLSLSKKAKGLFRQRDA